jgi:hypothetical protein
VYRVSAPAWRKMAQRRRQLGAVKTFVLPSFRSANTLKWCGQWLILPNGYWS